MPFPFFDRLVGFLQGGCLLLLLGLPVIYWGQLPEVIPIHYGANGLPDGFGPKSSLWALAFIGGLLFGVLQGINRYPQYFNYPRPIPEEKKVEVYRQAQRVIKLLSLYVLGLFTYIQWQTIRVAIGQAEGLGSAFLPVVFLPVVVGLGYALKQAFGVSKKK